MLLRTVNFDCISNGYKNLYILSMTVIYLIYFLMYICDQTLLPYFHSTSKVEFFSSILKIDSYLILKSDKNS